MNAASAAGENGRRAPKPIREVDQCFTVEFPVDGCGRHCQFKVWQKAPTYLSFIVKEYRDILARLKVGHRLNMKYYDTDLSRPSEYLETRIQKIKKSRRGPLRGQYLVGLEIQKIRH
jgi:hypothetical protein